MVGNLMSPAARNKSKDVGSDTLWLRHNDRRLPSFMSVGLPKRDVAQWINRGQPEIRLRRLSLATTYPFLVPMMVQRPDNVFSKDIFDWIGRDAISTEDIASLMGFSTEVIRFLANTPLELFLEAWIGPWSDELDLLFAVESLPEPNRPRTEDEWNTFNYLAKAVHPMPWGWTPNLFRSIYQQGTEQVYQVLAALTSDDDNVLINSARVHQALRLICRYLRFIETWVVPTPIAQNSDQKASDSTPSPDDLNEDFIAQEQADERVREIIAEHSLSELYQRAKQWEAVEARAILAHQMEVADPDLVTWPALFRRPIRVGTRWAYSICTIEDAIDFGEVLGNIRGSRLDELRYGTVHWILLRDQDAKAVSVFEVSISIHEGKALARCGKHMRLNGEYPHLEDDSCAEAIINWLESDEQRLPMISLSEFHERRNPMLLERIFASTEMNAALAERMFTALGER